jgi:hypothetical protein
MFATHKRVTDTSAAQKIEMQSLAHAGPVHVIAVWTSRIVLFESQSLTEISVLPVHHPVGWRVLNQHLEGGYQHAAALHH